MNRFAILAATGAISLGLAACEAPEAETAATGNGTTETRAEGGTAKEDADTGGKTPEQVLAERPDVPPLAKNSTRYLCEAGDMEYWVDVTKQGEARSGSFVASELHEGPNPIVYVDYTASAGANPSGGSAKTYLQSSEGSRLSFETTDEDEVYLTLTENGATESMNCYQEGSSYWN